MTCIAHVSPILVNNILSNHFQGTFADLTAQLERVSAQLSEDKLRTRLQSISDAGSNGVSLPAGVNAAGMVEDARRSKRTFGQVSCSSFNFAMGLKVESLALVTRASIRALRLLLERLDMGLAVERLVLLFSTVASRGLRIYRWSVDNVEPAGQFSHESHELGSLKAL